MTRKLKTTVRAFKKPRYEANDKICEASAILSVTCAIKKFTVNVTRPKKNENKMTRL